MRILVVRIGAFGDALIVTPIIRHLKKEGNEVYFLGSDQARQVLQENPNVDKFILHEKNSVKADQLGDYFKYLMDEHKCDKVVDLCESVEVRLALTTNYPQYNWTKKERAAYCDINYYQYAFIHAKIDVPINAGHDFFNPDMFFTPEEEDFIGDIRQKNLGKRIIMWGLSGSGRQKAYAYVPYIVGDILRDFKDTTLMLVGGEMCKILECAFPKHHRILKYSGEFSFRQSALMTKYADLVVSPDTGFLHTSGCWNTPKIGLLTHTTIENITKHFKNDFSIESKAPCAPCFRLIQNASVECPIEKESNSTLCMGKMYMEPERILERVKEALC